MKKADEPENPERVSWEVVDAWAAKPPCEHPDHPTCHVLCPYFDECNTEEDPEEDWSSC